MSIRTGPLTKEQWLEKIDEFIIDISKEEDTLALDVLELLIDKALDMRDMRQDLNNDVR